MNKKAMMNKYILVIILTLAILFVLMAFQSKLFASMNSGSTKQICKQSVLAHDFTKFGKVAMNTEIKCPTQEIKIKTKNQEKAKYQLAKAMYDCWDQFARGEANLFGDKETIYCSICHIISFKHQNKELEGFSEYLTTKKVPGGNGITYIEYLMNYDTPRAHEVAPETGDPNTFAGDFLDTSKTYSTIFLYAKGDDNMKMIAEHFKGQTTAGKTGWIAAGVGAGGIALVVFGVSNPIGWAMIGVGAIVVVASLVYDHFFNTDVEWSSFILFREYNEEQLKDIKCEVMPTSQE